MLTVEFQVIFIEFSQHLENLWRKRPVSTILLKASYTILEKAIKCRHETESITASV